MPRCNKQLVSWFTFACPERHVAHSDAAAGPGTPVGTAVPPMPGARPGHTSPKCSHRPTPPATLTAQPLHRHCLLRCAALMPGVPRRLPPPATPSRPPQRRASFHTAATPSHVTPGIFILLPPFPIQRVPIVCIWVRGSTCTKSAPAPLGMPLHITVVPLRPVPLCFVVRCWQVVLLPQDFHC